jgi:Icc-related predicted phosphoesterase
MKIVAISDIHGSLIQFEESGDLLLLAGDLFPATNHNLHYQHDWYKYKFARWLAKLPFKDIIIVAGNHDFFFEKMAHNKIISPLPLNCHYLMDEEIQIDDFKVYGSPWQPVFFNWAFNLTEARLKEKFDKIPNDTDILVTHGPPLRIGDGDVTFQRYDKSHKGSVALAEAVKRVKPKLHVYGHIHTGNHLVTTELYDNTECIFVNVSLLDEDYKRAYKPFVIELFK